VIGPSAPGRAREGTRRDALRRGAIGAAAALGVGAASSALGVAGAAGSEDDPAVLETAIAAEQVAVLAYSTAAGSGLLEKPVAEMARLFAEQERRHLEALTEPFTDLGGTVPEPPSVADVSGLGALRSQTDFLELAIGLENAAVAAYGQAQRKLETPALLRIATEICSNEGQHLVVLRQALGAGPAAAVPVAFEAGVSPPPGPQAR
jgi:rubrerythrin